MNVAQVEIVFMYVCPEESSSSRMLSGFGEINCRQPNVKQITLFSTFRQKIQNSLIDVYNSVINS